MPVSGNTNLLKDSPNGPLFEGEVRHTGRWSSVHMKSKVLHSPVTERPGQGTNWTDSCYGPSVGSSLRPFTFHCPPPTTSRLHSLPLLPNNRAHLNSVFRVEPSWSRQLRHKSCAFREHSESSEEAKFGLNGTQCVYMLQTGMDALLDTSTSK